MTSYSLADPRTGKVRYVGVSHDPETRLGQHISNPHDAVQGWIRELRRLSLRPVMKILDGRTEVYWIKRLRPDLNRNKGGGTGRPVRIDKRRHTVGFMANDMELEAVRDAAAAEGRTVADHVRRKVIPVIPARP